MLELRILGQVALAMAFGAVIGFEREMADKPAGMRTHMLVGGAAALLVLLGDLLVSRFGDDSGPWIRSDPIRVIEAITAGVAFLGAGTIIRQPGRSVVQGLTTAASLLFTAAMGICVGLGVYLLAAGATVLALLTLRAIGSVEDRLKRATEELTQKPDES